ncbi:hypothetical protein SAMN04488121_104417 [Chitinophaga filiformis]|uniref:Uncharacterized protein n=1 Tax=Chitinophaga filiformis TaxID=104663 RepID=A0A1G7ULM5_CHIFI|nr:hypothetical protein SAMN04488121_104417 [Chitinophaga filiformis]
MTESAFNDIDAGEEKFHKQIREHNVMIRTRETKHR